MSVLKCSILLAAIVCWADGAPSPPGGFSLMQLERVLSKAVCPTQVIIDDDPDRIPRLIKTLVCDKDPNAVCSAEETSHACCHHQQQSFMTECVQVMDTVAVRYNSDTLQDLHVPVGCTCTVKESRPTKDAS